MNKVNMQSFKKRARARKFALQALYGWLIACNDIKDVEKFYRADRNPKNYDEEYFIHLINSIATNAAHIDLDLTNFIDRAIADLDPIELTILRIATFEFQNSFDIPFKVIIHEAVDLAQAFGADQSYKFINHTLDKMARTIRQHEYVTIEACG